MASLIPGYNYDIFISYRQKDNKYDGWVTSFVEHLKAELESTFKEEISVYFDINPHDGLLETHDVDASLKDKLKCLVFIPIISRTYCDPKSFAWEHEFKAFVEQASKDKFGLKIKLTSGNVASRVLPIRIHDLDIADIKICEDILEGVLRGVEFIYKEPGVNRSLTPEDDEKLNLNKTRYRNQINKVALAINEVIQGLKTEPEWVRLKERIADEDHKQSVDITEGAKKKWKNKSDISGKWKIMSVAAVAIIFIIAAIFFYPKIFKKDTLEKLKSSGERISVAVMPFQNLTNDTIWNVWQDAIQFNLITSLSNYSDELKVNQAETIKGLLQVNNITNYASITPALANTISNKLDADVLIYGSINQAGSVLRINAQLIDTRTKEVFKSFQIDGEGENILRVGDSLSSVATNFLLISRLKQGNVGLTNLVSTNSQEAFRYFIYGRDAYHEAKNKTAIEWFRKALTIDSSFIAAIRYTCYSYRNKGDDKEAKEWCLKLRSKRGIMNIHEQLLADFQYAVQFETPYDVDRYAQQLLKLDNQSPEYYGFAGWNFTRLNQFSKAIPYYEKAFEIYDKWGSKPLSFYIYTFLGWSYHETGAFKKERGLYRKAETDFPDNTNIILRQAILALTQKDQEEANRYLKKYESLLRETSTSETIIIHNLGYIYKQANILDKAEEYYRQSQSLEPADPYILNDLAWFLIDKDRNINEGIELFEQARELNLDDYNYYDGKGYGLLKQGKYKEAFDLLEKAWEVKPEYNHETYLHLEAAKKAVAGQRK
jgi:TolB-like protein/Tfp pilus assembly protein PilF